MKLGYAILYVPDVPATVDFYERAFGLKARFVTPEGDFAEIDTGATSLALAQEDFVAKSLPDFRRNRPGEPPAGVEIAFLVEEAELDAAYARAVGAGATPLLAPERASWGQMFSYVRDPNGVLVEICCPVPGAD